MERVLEKYGLIHYMAVSVIILTVVAMATGEYRLAILGFALALLNIPIVWKNGWMKPDRLGWKLLNNKVMYRVIEIMWGKKESEKDYIAHLRKYG